jgi:hypothetical protein
VAKAVGTLVVFVISLVVGTYFVLNPNPLVAGIAFGIVGGIAHEIAQSGGKVIIPTTEPGGDLFLGSLAGAALGVVAGILSLHGVSLVNQTPDSMINIVVTSLSAGLGLKGIADVDPTQTKPQTPAQNL